MRLNSGHVLFEGSEPTKVFGSGKDSPREKTTNPKCVCLVEGLKHNILSVSQMVYGGKEEVFNSNVCFTRMEG